MVTVSAADAAEILGVLARYTQVIDNRDWEHLHTVFTPDFGFGAAPESLVGVGDFARLIDAVSPYHPHYSTDAVLHRVDDHTVQAWSKFLLARSDGSVASGDYIDTVVRSAVGWRIRTRVFSRGTRPPSDPGGSATRSFTLSTWLALP